MCTQTCIVIYLIVCQKYLVISIKVGRATRNLFANAGSTAEDVPTNNQ